MKKILILKNDRTGDLFTSLKTINLIFNKHKHDQIEIYLSKINENFKFLFKPKKIKVINLNLDFLNKIKILFYFFCNKIDTVYILTPKNFYFFLPLFFFYKQIKFYGICIDAKKFRPNLFLRKFLYKKIVINRINIKKRKSTYDIQQLLIEKQNNFTNLLNDNVASNLNFNFPKNPVYFHYKHKMFNDLLKWDFIKVKKFIEFLSSVKGNIVFSSELNNKSSDEFFTQSFNSYDFNNKKENIINSKKILFLKNIDGLNLYTTIKNSSKIIAPEGIITHIGYHLQKEILSLMHFNLRNRQDFINQIISCKEWFPPTKFNFVVLKKNFDDSIRKLEKRL